MAVLVISKSAVRTYWIGWFRGEMMGQCRMCDTPTMTLGVKIMRDRSVSNRTRKILTAELREHDMGYPVDLRTLPVHL